MARSHIDVNGFKVIDAMPISRVGVFPYLGKQIDYDGEMNLEPNRIYYVFRSPEELFAPDAIASFNGKPLIDNHEMLGKDFTKVDDRPADGSIYNVRPSLDMPDYLIADATIFTEKMIKKIASGKRELSLGYRCQYVPKAGVYNGQTYEFVQTNLRGNHLALVEHGRCGSSVCVCDGALITMDSLPKELQKMEEDEKKEAKLRSKLDACLKGDDEQGCQDALDFLDLPPEDRKAALASVKGKKVEPKAAPAEDSKAKDGEEIPAPPPPGSDKEPKEEEKPAEAAAPADVPAAPAEGEGDGEAEVEPPAEAVPPAEGADGCCGKKGKCKKSTKDEACENGGECVDVNPKDGKCDSCGKPVAKDGEPCCNEGKDGKSCCKDEGGAVATATTPSIPVPVSKVTDCGAAGGIVKKGIEALTQDELDSLTAKIRADYSRAQKLATAVRPAVGTFDSAEMSEVQVARYAASKIPALKFAVDAADDVVLGVIRGYVADHASRMQPKTVKVPTADEAVTATQSTGMSAENALRAFYN